MENVLLRCKVELQTPQRSTQYHVIVNNHRRGGSLCLVPQSLGYWSGSCALSYSRYHTSPWMRGHHTEGVASHSFHLSVTASKPWALYSTADTHLATPPSRLEKKKKI